MSKITLTAKAITRPLDCRALTPTALQGKSAADIAAMPLSTHLHVGDAFEVRVDDSVAAAQLLMHQTNAQHHYMGFAMQGGLLEITADAGDYLGAQMQQGQLLCHGHAGDRAGERMRRGSLLIEGDVGAYCASDMQAGTLAVLGRTGPYLGYGMRRGTVLLAQPPQLTPTWADCGPHSLPFLKLLYQSFKPLNSQFAALDNIRVQRWMGDLGSLGKGEILCLLPSTESA